MGSREELWGAAGSCGELRGAAGAVGSCGELWGAVGSCGELCCSIVKIRSVETGLGFGHHDCVR